MGCQVLTILAMQLSLSNPWLVHQASTSSGSEECKPTTVTQKLRPS